MTYKAYKCLKCGYDGQRNVKRALKPKCAECGSMRMREIPLEGIDFAQKPEQVNEPMPKKNKEPKQTELETPEKETEELTKADLGLEQQEAKTEEQKEPLGCCSECGYTIMEKTDSCPNCREEFN